MRFNHITSKLFNGVGRFLGLSEKIKYGENVVVGYHYYYKSSIFSYLYILSTIFDLFLVYPFKILLPLLTGKLIILDRFIYDILVDLMVDTGIYDLYDKWPAKLLQKALPGSSASFLLNVDMDKIRLRKNETIYDLNYEKKYNCYKKLSARLRLNIIDNNTTVEETLKTIIQRINRKNET